jgi:hypothetical protein
MWAGIAQFIKRLAMGWTVRGSIPGRARYSAVVQNDPGARPAPYTVGIGSFPGIKRPGCDFDHPPPSSAEIKESGDLYLYSISGHSWLVLS